MDPKFFKTPEEFRKWFEKNHEKETELLVGFYKKGTAKPSITWPESVEQALCFGWIDGVRKSLGEESYTIRFTPRRPGSIWSTVNIKLVEKLKEQGLMRPAGLTAFEKRSEHKSSVYSFEQNEVSLNAYFEQKFRANKKAWDFFNEQPEGYRKTATWWVISAKQESTREKRFRVLVDDSEKGLRIAQLRR